MKYDGLAFTQALIGFAIIIIIFLLIAHLDYVQLHCY